LCISLLFSRQYKHMFAPDAQSYLNATTFHFLFNSALHIQMGEIVSKLAQNHIFSPNSGDLMQGHSHILPKDCKTAPSPRRSVATAGNASRAALSIDTAQEHKGSETQRCSSIPSSTGATEAREAGAAARSSAVHSASIATLLHAKSCLIPSNPRHSQAQLLA
jgi:hypothetical protein